MLRTQATRWVDVLGYGGLLLFSIETAIVLFGAPGMHCFLPRRTAPAVAAGFLVLWACFTMLGFRRGFTWSKARRDGAVLAVIGAVTLVFFMQWHRC